MKIYQRYKEGFLQFLGGLFFKTSSANCYSSIDELPIWYWNKIHEEKNLSYLKKSKQLLISMALPKRIEAASLAILWRKILAEYIDKFGFSEKHLDLMRKEKEILFYRIKRAVNGDRTMNAFVKIAEEEREAIQSDMKGGNFWEIKAVLNKSGFDIDPYKTSVSEFYSCLKLLREQSKKTSTNQAS